MNILELSGCQNMPLRFEKSSKLSLSFSILVFGIAVFLAPVSVAQQALNGSTGVHRIKISEVVAASLLVEKVPITYPEAAFNIGLEGKVVLEVITNEAGVVKDVSVVSGDPLLALDAADQVKRWKYKPYVIDGVPTEMETQVTLNFRLSLPHRGGPPLGVFKEGRYVNEFFDMEYPLSRDWVRETEAMHKRAAADGHPRDTYVLLAAIHIPRDYSDPEADSSFVLSAVEKANRNCGQYLESIRDELHSRKQAREIGAVVPLTVAGRDFYRADFEFRENPNYRTSVCMQSKDYLLEWNIVGLSKDAIQSAVSTLDGISAVKSNLVAASATDASGNGIQALNVPAPVMEAMIRKKVQPIYHLAAKAHKAQGQVRMRAVISNGGDVVDLEVLDGPFELAVSAANAVRQWKYKPYLVNGEPVAVNTEITVDYELPLGSNF